MADLVHLVGICFLHTFAEVNKKQTINCSEGYDWQEKRNC